MRSDIVVAILGAQSSIFPAPYPRSVRLRARVGFQGITATTQQFGSFRAWGPELGSLTDQDADSYIRQITAAGYSAVEFAVSWNYVTPYFNVPGSDLSQNLSELRRRVKRAIQVGKPMGLQAVYLFCAGDGLSVNSNPQPGQYNDPFGHTYGREWLLQNFARIYAAFGPQPDDPTDLRDWMVFIPGYDGCDAYQWGSGPNVAEVWQLMDRVVHGGGHSLVGFEWPAGQIQLGDGFDTYGPANGGCIDLWLLEDPIGWYPPTDTSSIQQITQQAARAVRPYLRPNWAVDDPNPPLLIPPTNRYGQEAIVQFYEHTTYAWVHGCDEAQVVNNRAVLRSIAPTSIIC